MPLEREGKMVAVPIKLVTQDPCDGTVLHLDSGGGHINLHVIKLHRTKHIHTRKHK